MPTTREPNGAAVRAASPEYMGKQAQAQRYSQTIADFRRQLSVTSCGPQQSAVLDTLVTVCARKRPLIPAELEKGYTDGVTTHGRDVYVHRRIPHLDKLETDHARFHLDLVFDDKSEERTVYANVLQPLVQFAATGVWQKPHVGLLLLYGQTSSGKTYTATSLHRSLAEEICAPGCPPFRLAFFEIRGGHAWDLFAEGRHGRRCMMRETPDEVNIAGLKEYDVQNAAHMLQLISAGSRLRSTSTTAQNVASSRSHALLRITWGASGKHGSSFSSRLWIVDLAGAEKAADSLSDSRERRLEGADINQSLLALKECVRAMRSNPGGRVPFRASRLTLTLKDAFHRRPNVPSEKRVVMFCCLAPCAHQTEASVDTLRFATMMREAPGRGAGAQILANEEVVESLSFVEEAFTDDEIGPTAAVCKNRRSSLADVDFVLAAANTTEPISETTISGVTNGVEIPMVASSSLPVPSDHRHFRHSRLVSELFYTENELLCSLQDAVSACEKRLSKMKQLTEQAADSVDLSEMCWKVVDSMAEQSSEAAALQGRALVLLRTIQREEGERPRFGLAQDVQPMMKEVVLDKRQILQTDQRGRGRPNSPGPPKSPTLSPRTVVSGKSLQVARSVPVATVITAERNSWAHTAQPVQPNRISTPQSSSRPLWGSTTLTPGSTTLNPGSLTVPVGPARSSITSFEQRRIR